MAECRKDAVAYLSLGANLGDRRQNLRRAVHALDDHPGIKVDWWGGVASLYASSPVGRDEPQPDYLNTAIRARTALAPHDMLSVLMTIEATLGRVRQERWGPRIIDIDLLLFGDRIIDDEDLTVPHPRLAERRFVLDPLAEIAADVVHPVIGKSIGELQRRHAGLEDDHDTRPIAGPSWMVRTLYPVDARSIQ